jgi:sugar phosphate isomerase/epimerase
MMLAVSNIAWASCDRLAAYELLARQGIDGLEIAPGLFLDSADDPFSPDDVTLKRARSEIEVAGLRLVSMQSLLFGVQGAALFGPPEARERFCDGMMRAIALAGLLEVPNLVFGSPRQRIIPDGMTASQAQDVAIEIFGRLADAAAKVGSQLAVEANPEAYGTNFLTNIEAALQFVRAVDHPALTLNFDVGAMHMNQAFEQIDLLIPEAIDRISHVHVSEPFLVPAPAQEEDAHHLFTVLGNAGYEKWVSLEMMAPDGGLDILEANVARLARAARTAGT